MASLWLGRGWSQECSVCLSGGELGESSSNKLNGGGGPQEEPSPGPWKPAWQGPCVCQEPRSRKGWLGRFLVSPGVMGGFRGRSAISVLQPDTGSCSPWTKGRPS